MQVTLRTSFGLENQKPFFSDIVFAWHSHFYPGEHQAVEFCPQYWMRPKVSFRLVLFNADWRWHIFLNKISLQCAWHLKEMILQLALLFKRGSSCDETPSQYFPYFSSGHQWYCKNTAQTPFSPQTTIEKKKKTEFTRHLTLEIWLTITV